MAQFQVEDIVLYGSNGACKIKEIEHRDQGSYYVLAPVHKDRTKFMVPVDNERLVSRMRPVPTRKTVQESIRKASSTEPFWIDDNSERKEHAKAILDHGTEFDMLMLARSFHVHKEHVAEIGKKSTSSDSNILRSVQEHIRDEFSVVFGIDPDDVDDFIQSQAHGRA